MKIVCIGDSLTYGYGVYKEKCWVDILRKNLNIRVLNRGINGDTSAGMLSRSIRDVAENNPDAVIIMGGSNDFLAGHGLARVQENIASLVKEAEHFGIKPIIGIQTAIEEKMAIEKWSSDVDYSGINEKIAEYRNWVIKYCEDMGIVYIDFYKALCEKRKCMGSEEIYIDGLHPTEFGYKVMAECAIKELNSIFH